MPSPFPGMDPYLERSDGWRGLHLLLLSEFAALLQPQLNSIGHYIDLEEHVYLSEAGRDVIPDAAVHDGPAGSGYRHPATAVVDEPVRVAELRDERMRFLEITSVEERRAVTVLELFSPTNKSRPDGRTQYTRKRRELDQEAVSLVEIDLRRGEPPLVVLPDDVLAGHPHDYLVNIIRADSSDGEFYPIRLRDRLPRVRIPLAGEDPDAALDLQAALALDAAYARGPYAMRIDYAADPPPPRLPQDDIDWIDALLKQKCLR